MHQAFGDEANDRSAVMAALVMVLQVPLSQSARLAESVTPISYQQHILIQSHKAVNNRCINARGSISWTLRFSSKPGLWLAR